VLRGWSWRNSWRIGNARLTGKLAEQPGKRQPNQMPNDRNNYQNYQEDKEDCEKDVHVNQRVARESAKTIPQIRFVRPYFGTHASGVLTSPCYHPHFIEGTHHHESFCRA
jgi:hypothetical protein